MKKNPLQFISLHPKLFIGFFFILLSSTYILSFAAPIAPGSTLDPTCAPGAVDCFVQIIPSQTGNTNKYLTTNGTSTSWSPQTLVLGGNFTTAGANPITLTTSGTTTLTLPTSGTLATTSASTNYIPKIAGTNLANSLLYDDGTNIGIGTILPSSKLSVQGDIRIMAGSGGQIIFADGSTMSSAGLGSAAALSNATDAIVTSDSDASSTGDILLKTGSTTRLSIANAGTITIPAFTTGVLTSNGSGILSSSTTLTGLTSVTSTSFVGSLTGNASTVTTNANLTGPITSVGNATSVASQTGTGSTFVMQASPTLTTPNIGAATGTSLNLSSGAITSGLINGQTISSAANFTGTLTTADYINLNSSNPGWGAGFTNNMLNMRGGALGGTSATDFRIMQNIYYNGGAYIARATGETSSLLLSDGALYYYNSPSTTGGAAVTSTERFHILNTGEAVFAGSVAGQAASFTSGAFSDNITITSASTKGLIINSTNGASFRGIQIQNNGGSQAGFEMDGNTGQIKIGGYFGTGDFFPVIYSDGVAALTFGLGATPSATFTGTVFVPGAVNALRNSTATTSRVNGYFSNTSADMIWGIEGSSGGSMIVGTSAYSTVIGNTVAQPLHLGTNNAIAMTILSGGNVGIGTTTPASLLHVVGNNLIQKIIASTSTNGAYTQYANNAGSFYIGLDDSTGAQFGSAYSANIYHTGAYPLRLFTSGVVRQTIDANGNVGIGTTTPVTGLHLNNATPYITASNSNANLSINDTIGGINFYSNDGSTNSTGGVGSIRVNAAATFNTGGTSSYMSFYTQSDSANNGTALGVSTERMRITELGNVNIGGGVLSNALSVYRATGDTTVRLTTEGDGGAAGLLLVSDNSGGTSRAYYFATNVGVTDNSLVIYDATAGAARMTISTGGLISGDFNDTSDVRLKKNINSLAEVSGLDAINQLRPVSFNWIDPTSRSDLQLGFIAQEVQQIFPDLVAKTSPTSLTPDGTYIIKYTGLIAPIIKAIQEMDIKVEGIPTLADQTLYSKISEFLQGIAERGEAVVNKIKTNDVDTQNIKTTNLCVGAVCVTENQFLQMVQSSSQGASVTPPPTPSCTDGIQNQDETGIDEGGVCTPTPDPEPQPEPDPEPTPTP